MKSVIRTAAILAVACSATFTSCVKKKLTEDTNETLNSYKDQQFYESNGSVSAKFTGELKKFSGYTDQEYSVSRTFSFLQDNIDDNSLPSNYVTTVKHLNTIKLTPDLNCDYTVKHFTIQMYGASGENKTDFSSREEITISFNYYEGTLPKYKITEGTKVKTPTEIEIDYKLAYIPKETIDLLDVTGEIKPTSANGEIKNQVIITDFTFEPATGKISFSFSADDTTVDGGKERISEGKVNTKILVNHILPENTQKD